jgi:hypothetical protein
MQLVTFAVVYSESHRRMLHTDAAKVHCVSPISNHFGTVLGTQTGSPGVFQRGNFLEPQITPTISDRVHCQDLSRAPLAFCIK